MFHSSIMDTIRYEYAEESSNSSGSADPALFKKSLIRWSLTTDIAVRHLITTWTVWLVTAENQAYEPLDAKLTLSTTTDDLLAPLSYGLPPSQHSSNTPHGVLASLDNTAQQHQDVYAIHSPSNYTTHHHQHQSYDNQEDDSFDVSGFVQECLTDPDGYRRVIVGCDSSSGYAEYKYEEEDDFGFDENTPVEQEKSQAACARSNGGGPPRRPPGQTGHSGGGAMYSFSCLIGLALKNSSSGELTVSEIYAFLCEHFPYFRAAPSGWKNSVRHNLSLNKCFQKIEVETPGCHGRKSCLWRLNPHRETKMDHELRKARERNEPLILKAMTNPEDLDSIQAGTKGMPSTVRRRIVVPIEETTYVMKSAPPKIIRRTPYSTNQSNTSQQRLPVGSSTSYASNQPAQSKLSTSSGESAREAAAHMDEELLKTSPPTQKRSSGGNSHSSKTEDFSDFGENSTPNRRSSNSNHSNGQSKLRSPEFAGGKSHQRSPLQPSSSHNPTSTTSINKPVPKKVVASRENSAHTDYYSRHNFHNYQQPPPATTRAILQRPAGQKPTSSQMQMKTQQDNKPVEWGYYNKTHDSNSLWSDSGIPSGSKWTPSEFPEAPTGFPSNPQWDPHYDTTWESVGFHWGFWWDPKWIQVDSSEFPGSSHWIPIKSPVGPHYDTTWESVGFHWGFVVIR
uniref:Fork-head domain-containing protein n=1 Tax=Ditylenchus dipsaci TaxID=166011 RepID=A0A915D070_9BILA